jgi:translocator protein
MTIPAWLEIGVVTFFVALGASFIAPEDLCWFKKLARPRWLTFEGIIPMVWTVILICGAWSAYLVWQTNPGSIVAWQLMGFYLLVEMVIIAYTPVMCKLHSLKAGIVIGASGFLLGLILTITIMPISFWAGVLLIPYLLWSPVGTFITWKMAQLNPQDRYLS